MGNTLGGPGVYKALPGAARFSQLDPGSEPDYSPLMVTLQDLIKRGAMLPEAAAVVTRKLWAPVMNHPVTQARMAAMNQRALAALGQTPQPQAMQTPPPPQAMPAGPNLYNGIDLYH